MSKTFLFSIGLSTCLAGAAAAQTGCVTSASLDDGILLDFADGTTESYRNAGQGVLEVVGSEGEQPYFELLIAQGTHLLSYVAIDGGGRDEASLQTYDYGVEPTELPVPVAGERASFEVTVTASDGPRQEGQLQAYVEGEPLVVNGCTYDAIDVLIAYDTADNYMENIRYIPDLGLGYLLWNQADDGRSDDNIVMGIRTGK